MTIPENATVTVTNTSQAGSGFAIMHETGVGCFIPANIMNATGAVPGNVMYATLTENPATHAHDRTPYMVTSMEPIQLNLPLGIPDKGETVAERAEAFTRATMKAGGVWTISTMFNALEGADASRTENLESYNAISKTLRGMFNNGECSKWVLYRSSSQTKASKEWFGCFPDRVDVDEFAD